MSTLAREDASKSWSSLLCQKLHTLYHATSISMIIGQLPICGNYRKNQHQIAFCSIMCHVMFLLYSFATSNLICTPECKPNQDQPTVLLALLLLPTLVAGFRFGWLQLSTQQILRRLVTGGQKMINRLKEMGNPKGRYTCRLCQFWCNFLD